MDGDESSIYFIGSVSVLLDQGLILYKIKDRNSHHSRTELNSTYFSSGRLKEP